MLELISYGLYVVAFIGGIYCAYKLWFALSHFRIKRLYSPALSIDELPSVSVCIPARNETNAMTQCLERVVASNYPKMEIIVLDDSSVDNTSILIKSFAHAGVRFVEGSPLEEGWLGKNHALQGLLDEASGTYILFMDVDTQISPDSIGQLVAYAEHKEIDMVSVLPTRRAHVWRMSTIFATLRHFWVIVTHGASRPAAASNAWMIKRSLLQQDFGSFEPYRLSVQPEIQLAAALAPKNRYRFLISTALLGISYEKKWSSQVETGIRLLYPMVGGRTLFGFLALLFLVALVWPIIVLVSAVFVSWGFVHTLGALVLGLWIALYTIFLARVWPSGWITGLCTWPIVLVQELIIFVRSMVGYFRHTITWKGRPIAARARKVI